MQRPAGIILLAIIHFIIAGLFLVAGVSWILFVRLMADQFVGVSVESPLPVDASDELRWMVEKGPLAGVLFILYAALKGASGWGLLMLRHWGRWLTIALAALTMGVTLPGLLSAVARAQWLETGLNLIFVAGYAAILWYLFTPAIRSAFQAK
ncbi:MAG: hypothetical protein ACE5HB_02515 [Terriglobia bacterium]